MTHGGGVVFRLTSRGARYLLVEASGTRDRWVFPKGHIEDGETAESAALREVGEEAGVRARLIRRLSPIEQKKEGEWISIAYFLMAYAGRTKALERRRIRWLTYDEALEALDRGKSRRVLRSADRLVSAATGAEPRRYRIRRALVHLAEWLCLGMLALLFIPSVMALPAGALVSFAMRVLLRPLEGLVCGEDDATLPSGDRELRLLVGGAEWIKRTDYLGAPIRVAGALAVLLPGAPARGEWWVAPMGLALAALAGWILRKYSRASAAVLVCLALLLAAHSIVTSGNPFAVMAAFVASALAAIAWWRLERRRANLVAAVTRATPT